MAPVRSLDTPGADVSPGTRRRTRALAILVALVVCVGVVVSVVLVRARTGEQAAPALQPDRDPTHWNLVWESSFDDDSLDPTQWRALDRSTFGDGGLQLACLMAGPQNVQVHDGVLDLTARRESPALPCGASDDRFPSGRDYTSAMVSTEGLASWSSGVLEVRAKLPMAAGASQGLWPAIWMRPDDKGVGEIDVMEAIGTGDDLTEVGRIHQTLHYDYQGTHPKVASVPDLPDFDPTEFHVYGLAWGDGTMQWTVDGAVTFSLDETTTPWLGELLGKPYFLRMNLAVGGRWPGDPTSATDLPATMQVDWVRVYQPR